MLNLPDFRLLTSQLHRKSQVLGEIRWFVHGPTPEAHFSK
jgi:hypothetical protein